MREAVNALCIATTQFQVLMINEYLYCAEERYNADLIYLEKGVLRRGKEHSDSLYPPGTISGLIRVSAGDSSLKDKPIETLVEWFQSKKQIANFMSRSEYSAVICGDSSYPMVHWVLKEFCDQLPVIWVDDGVSTLLRLCEVPEKKRSTTIEKIKFLAIGNSFRERKRANIFTAFSRSNATKSVSTSENSLLYLKSLLNFCPSNAIHFLGQPLVEFKKAKEADLFRILNTVYDRYGDFTYWAHPAEAEDRLKKLQEIPGVDVKKDYRPYELNLTAMEFHPKCILSISSTAVLTTSLLTNGMIDCYYCAPSLAGKNYFDNRFVKQCEKLYQKAIAYPYVKVIR